ncbi:iron chelate uptake ABC transporter family permease subunit [Gynuella sp.]|uniref:iron chelate uptake ABC transporter family permease subunit n=1 Tax=Gynuella sp. TaxID=2969146 RepID=UPI003D143612
MWLKTALLLIVLLLLAWCSLFAWSPVHISPAQTLLALFRPQADSIVHAVVLDLRLPRMLTSMLVGASLAAAGVLMQGLTRNALASPSILGINAGAALGMALVSTVSSLMGVMLSSVAAVIGGGIAWILVMLLGAAWRPGAERGRLVLAGVAVSALCAALTKAAVIMAEDQAAGVITWLAGSVANARWSVLAYLWPAVIPALFIALMLAPTLNLLTLGDDGARNLGVHIGWIRLLVGCVVLLLVGPTVAAVGSIAFVGLLVPHMARGWMGVDHRRVLPFSMLLGAALVLLADIVSRAVVYPVETPAGAILALIGAPFFIYMVKVRT